MRKIVLEIIKVVCDLLVNVALMYFFFKIITAK